jgi:hypothetical protein
LAVSDETWKDGAEAVAARIEEIRAEWLVDSLPQAEELSKDKADGKYVVGTVVQGADEMISAIFDQLDFSLEMALRGHNVSGFSDLCVGYRYLEHTRLNCRDDPNAVHMHLKIARETIAAKLETGEYQTEEGLSAMLVAIERHEVQLRADHPVVREAHKTFVAQRLRELDDERKLAIAAEFKALEDESKERLSDEFGLDAETLESDSGEEAQADAIKRSGGRSQVIALAERASEAAKGVDKSGGWKATKIGLTVIKIGQLLSGVL